MTTSFKLSLFLTFFHHKSLCISRLRQLRMTYNFPVGVILYIRYKEATIHQSLLNMTTGNEDRINVDEIPVHELLTGSLILHDT
jgi:hypothetical protein